VDDCNELCCTELCCDEDEDCVDDEQVLCYTEYKCKEWLAPNEEQCIYNPILEMYQCFYRKDLPEWRCHMCQRDLDDPGVQHMKMSKKCVD